MQSHPEVFFYHPAGSGGLPLPVPGIFRKIAGGLPFFGQQAEKNFRMGIIGRKPAEKTGKFGRCAHCTGAAAVL